MAVVQFNVDLSYLGEAMGDFSLQSLLRDFF